MKNCDHQIRHHRLIMDIKDKALRNGLECVFEKFPSSLRADTLEVNVDSFDNLGGQITVNSKWVKLSMGQGYRSGDEYIPAIEKIGELTKLLSKDKFEFSRSTDSLNEKVQKYNLRPFEMIDMAEYDNERYVRQRFASEVTQKSFYDIEKVRKVVKSLNDVIQKDMEWFLGG